MSGAAKTLQKQITPWPQRLARLRELDSLSRQRVLDDRESRELERLLMSDYQRRLRLGQPIPRGIS